ncbi:MAG: Propanediol utilization protein [Clostridia bacterium]|jgi:putative phosphotransacetylase|nr:Propanediol utilization protein [Clostridia bacterium]
MVYDEKLVRTISEIVLQEIQKIRRSQRLAPVGISARHVHLSKKDAEVLFGRGYALTHFKELSQPGQFAANEVVELIGPAGTIHKVRVLGPERPKTQIEVALSDARKLGLKPPVRSSGDIEGTPGIILKGPKGEVEIPFGVIISERHMHLSREEAKGFELQDGDKVRAFIEGPKGGVMEHITVRVHEDYRLDLHIDTDDANAFNIVQGQYLKFEKMNE